MMSDESRIANFIIGGTEKAGTTSVFMYLSEHPEVCGSSSKETDFFRSGFTGSKLQDLEQYSRFFPRCQREVIAPVVMEASPGYLGDAAQVVPRIASLAPDARFLFILRDPIDRLYSSYNFHVNKLNIDESITFQDYVERCLSYDRGEKPAEQLELDDWYLKVLRYGCYADFLPLFINTFGRDRVKVMFFDDLNRDVAGFMKEVSRFLAIDDTFWDRYEFQKTNVTFSSKSKLLHRLAMFVNTQAESLLRQRPRLKRALVDVYKRFNQKREGYDPMSAGVRSRLEGYYRPANQALHELLGQGIPEGWCI